MKNNYEYIIAIDPGITGGITIIDLKSGDVKVHGVPSLIEIKNKKNKKNYDIVAMADLLRPYSGNNTIAVIEKVYSMSGQGVTSMFNFGRGVGLWEGIFGGLGFDVEHVSPQTWKKQWAEELLVKIPRPEEIKMTKLEYKKLSVKKQKEYDEIEKEWTQKKTKAKREAKDAARHLAQKLYPNLANEFKLKKHDGKAESLLLGERKRMEIKNAR